MSNYGKFPEDQELMDSTYAKFIAEMTWPVVRVRGKDRWPMDQGNEIITVDEGYRKGNRYLKLFVNATVRDGVKLTGAGNIILGFPGSDGSGLDDLPYQMMLENSEEYPNFRRLELLIEWFNSKLAIEHKRQNWPDCMNRLHCWRAVVAFIDVQGFQNQVGINAPSSVHARAGYGLRFAM